MANQMPKASTSPLLPAVVSVTAANKPPSCGIEIGRTVSSISGNPAGLRIASLDPVFCYMYRSTALTPKNSVDAAMKLLAEATGDTAKIKVLRTNTQTYREAHVSARFRNEYNIEFESSKKAILKPKDNPSVLKATLAPMYFTRFKYSITFDDRAGAVSFEDLYAITFNRSNGATPQQQQRIQDRHHAFKSQLEKMEATMMHSKGEAQKLALAS